jgi:hypothetical protein
MADQVKFKAQRYGYSCLRCDWIVQNGTDFRKFVDTIERANCPCKPRDEGKTCDPMFRLVKKLLFLDNVGEPPANEEQREYDCVSGGQYRRMDYDSNAMLLCSYLDRTIVSGNMSAGQACLVHLFLGIILRGYPHVAVKPHDFSIERSGINCYDHACEAISVRKSLGDTCVPPFRFRGRLYHKEKQLDTVYPRKTQKERKKRCMNACCDFEVVLQQEKNDIHANEFKERCPYAEHNNENSRCLIDKNKICLQ